MKARSTAWYLAEYHRDPRVNYAERSRSMRNDANAWLVHYRYRDNDAEDDANRSLIKDEKSR